MFLIFTFYNGRIFLKDFQVLSHFLKIIFWALVGVLIVVFVFHKWIYKKLKSYKYVELVKEGIHNTPISNAQILFSLLLSFVQMSFWALAIYFILLSVDIPVGFMFCLSIVPLMVISFTIPLSYQGLGLPETVMILYGSIFYDKSTLILAAAFQLIFYLLIIVIGAMIYLIDNKEKD